MAVDIDGEKRECFRSRPRWRWWKETIYNGDSQCIPLWFRSGSDLIIEDLYDEFLLLVFVSISQIWEKLNIIFIALYVLDFLLCLFLCFLLCALFYSVTIFACCLLFIESHCGHGALILCTFLILCFGVWLYGVATVLPWRERTSRRCVKTEKTRGRRERHFFIGVFFFNLFWRNHTHCNS